MPVAAAIQRNFTAGELSPLLGARADQAKYLAGLKTCRNFLVLRQGGVSNRPGTQYVAAVKDSTHTPRLIPFIFEAADQTYLIECGGGYFRFYWHGAPVVVSGVAAYNGATAYVPGNLVASGGVNYYCIANTTGNAPPNATYWYALTGNTYEIPNPYAGADVGTIQWTQSADTLTLVHPNYAPQELKRTGGTGAQPVWILNTFSTAPSINPPTSPHGSAGAAGTLTFRYVITALTADFEESYVSSIVTIGSCATPTATAPNTLGWTASSGAVEYNVYADPVGNGIYGFVGTAAGTSFSDPGYAPDFTDAPPTQVDLFNATGDYPSTVAYYQQRLAFARSTNNPETVWLSQTGAYHNFSIRTPLQDDDSISFVLAGDQLSPVAHIKSLSKQLAILSDVGVFVARGDTDGVLKPSAINADQESSIGAAPSARPIATGETLLYVQNRGSVLRELAYDLYQGGFVGRDLSIFASHLLEGYTLTALDYAFQPFSTVWAIRSDGTLLGLTYVPDQQVWGWHRHDTGASGAFEAVCVLPDTTRGEDVPYFCVKRTINGSTVRYIERFASRLVKTLSTDAVFMDASLTYNGAPATTFSGLNHLEGQQVAILGDGVVVSDGVNSPTYTVTGGAVTLPVARSVATFGIPIGYPDLQTLDLDVQGSDIRGKRKRVQSLTVLVDDSCSGFSAGPDTSHLIKQRRESWDATVEPATGALEVNLTAGFTDTGGLVIRQTLPLPLTVLGIIPNVEVS